MPFIFVVNDISSNGKILPAPKVADILLDKGRWLFTRSTPKITTLESDKKVLVYIAGKGRRFFYASFDIAGGVAELNLENEDLGEFFRFFTLYCPIKNINKWSEFVQIENIKQNLKFIIDQKNWGLFFRQSIKEISIEDYNYIISRRRNNTQ